MLLEFCPARFLAKANGKFAIARTGPWGLQLIRDRIGEEQIYYAQMADGGFVFSSSIRSLVAILPGAEFYTPQSVRVFETPVGAETMFRGIAKLESGTELTLRPDGCWSTRRYWEISPREWDGRTDAEITEEFRELLKVAVCERLPVGGDASAFLSGGQDSSWVSCALTSLGHRPRRVYTTAFRELDSVYNESPHARRVANHIGAEHVVLEPGAADFVEHFPAAMAIFDEVKANAAHFSEYWIARQAAAQGDRVLFSGYGSDEALGGEVRYLVMYLDRNRGSSAPLFDHHPMLVNYSPLFKKLGEQEMTAPEWQKYYGLMKRGTPDGEEVSYQEMVRHEFGRSGRLVDQMGLADIAISGPPLLDTTKVDKYWGIDKVCPFLDPRVVDFAFSLPEHLKISQFTTKVLLRNISRGLVPDEITDRSDKVGFAFPHNEPSYAAYIGTLADSWAHRAGVQVAADPVRGRYDRTVLMAASHELICRSYEAPLPVAAKA